MFDFHYDRKRRTYDVSYNTYVIYRYVSFFTSCGVHTL